MINLFVEFGKKRYIKYQNDFDALLKMYKDNKYLMSFRNEN